MAEKILDVPYRSQWAEDATKHSSDCGPTCVAMIVNYYQKSLTPNEGYDILERNHGITFRPNQYTQTFDLQKIFKAKRVEAKINWFGNQRDALAQIEWQINRNKPLIALVNYVPWQRITGRTFNGSHFVVVTGYDNNHIFLHDPLFPHELTPQKGAHFKMSRADFRKGWGGFNNPNYSRSKNANPDWLMIHPFEAPKLDPVVVVPPPPPVVDDGAITPIDPPVTPTPIDPTPPQTGGPITIDDSLKRRLTALATWHQTSIDWDDRREVQAWANHIDTFGKEVAHHQVAAGQTLAGVAGMFYGAQDKWRVIKAFNRLTADWAFAGQWLQIPLFGSGTAHLSQPDIPSRLESIPVIGAAVEAITEAFGMDDEPMMAEAAAVAVVADDEPPAAPDFSEMTQFTAEIGRFESVAADGQNDDSAAAGFSSDPDVTATTFETGERFKAIWTFRNTGDTTWDDTYHLVRIPKTPDHTGGIPTAQMAPEASYSLGDVGSKEFVRPGESVVVTIEMVAPNIDGVVATHWQLHNAAGQPFGALRWVSAEIVARSITPEPIDPTPEPEPRDETPHTIFVPIVSKPKPVIPTVTYGMNINPNLDSSDSREIDPRDVDIENQRGLGWVRYAYWASRNGRSGKEAYVKRYRDLIKTYADAGIKTLIVLHQDTYWGHGPWDHGQWGRYAAEFGRVCGEVATACAEFGHMVAYQIFNETDSRWGDDVNNPNKSAIGLPPEKYAIILQSAANAIRAGDPKATIVASGMKTGPQNAVNYLKQVQQALRKPLPVDALAYHPYGRRAQSQFDFVPFGTLEDAFKPFKQAFPDLPIWLTEIGVPGHEHVFPPDRYSDIQTFMDEAIEDFKEKHAAQVPVVIWFAWSDFSENSGIITKNGQFKAGIAEAYNKMRA